MVKTRPVHRLGPIPPSSLNWNWMASQEAPGSQGSPMSISPEQLQEMLKQNGAQ